MMSLTLIVGVMFDNIHIIYMVGVQITPETLSMKHRNLCPRNAGTLSSKYRNRCPVETGTGVQLFPEPVSS